MEIFTKQLPIHNETLLNQLLDFQEEIHLSYYNDDALYSRQFRKNELKTPPPVHLLKIFVIAREKDKITGRGFLIRWGGEDDPNNDRCFITVDVLPNYTSQSIASSIVGHIKKLAIERNLITYEAWIKSNIEDNYAEKWLERLGAKNMLVEKKNRLYRKDMDMEKINRWYSKLSEKLNESYRIIKFKDENYYKKVLNDETFASHLVNLYNEIENLVPSGESTAEASYLTLGQLREEVQSNLEISNWDGLRLFAISKENDEIVGLTKVFYPKNEALKEINTGLTGVKKEHQKQGLASLLKVKMIKELEEKDFEYIETENARDNISMNIVNTKLGFKEVYLLKAYEGKIEDLPNST